MRISRRHPNVVVKRTVQNLEPRDVTDLGHVRTSAVKLPRFPRCTVRRSKRRGVQRRARNSDASDCNLEDADCSALLASAALSHPSKPARQVLHSIALGRRIVNHAALARPANARRGDAFCSTAASLAVPGRGFVGMCKCHAAGFEQFLT